MPPGCDAAVCSGGRGRAWCVPGRSARAGVRSQRSDKPMPGRRANGGVLEARGALARTRQRSAVPSGQSWLLLPAPLFTTTSSSARCIPRPPSPARLPCQLLVPAVPRSPLPLPCVLRPHRLLSPPRCPDVIGAACRSAIRPRPRYKPAPAPCRARQTTALVLRPVRPIRAPSASHPPIPPCPTRTRRPARLPPPSAAARPLPARPSPTCSVASPPARAPTTPTITPTPTPMRTIRVQSPLPPPRPTVAACH